MPRPHARRVLALLWSLLALIAVPGILRAQVGQVSGSVTDAATDEPLSAVQVFLQGTSINVLTDNAGRFTLTNVGAGEYTLVAQRIGYVASRVSVSVTAGQVSTVTVELNPTVLSMQEIVATGLIDPVEGLRSPITVDRVDRDLMPTVVAGSAIQNLQGRVPGVNVNRGSGQPGTGTNIMLRTPTSVVMTGQPLIVVDGVIIGTDNTANFTLLGGTPDQTVNIESLDIESIEVVKGAAAASLYGSRAAAGVIAITTNRGRDLAIGQTRFTARTEIGFTEAARELDLPTHHHYLVDDLANPTTFVDEEGNPVDRELRTANFFAPGIAFMDTRYPGQLFNNQRSAFRPGNFTTHSVSMAQNSANTNFAISLNRRVEQGALVNNKGYELNSFRINLDHRFHESVNLGISAYHSRDYRDNPLASFNQILQAPPDVDLGAKDPETGEFVRVLPGDVSYFNPLWDETATDDDRWRARTLASATLRWTPMTWLTASGNISYDRQDSERRQYVPLGTPLSETASLGDIRFDYGRDDVWNGEAQLSLHRDFGGLNARTTGRAIFEKDQRYDRFARGQEFLVPDVPDISAAQTQTSGSNESEVRALGFLWDNALDYQGKYIVTGLIRRDGSSLFGPENRWHTYYRLAGSYRLAEEPWFNVRGVDEFKISYARGTAGGRPSFSAQYETWNVSQAGLSKGTLGNKELRPEHTTEQEISLDVILFGRYSIDLTYAWQKTTEQLVTANLPSVTGYTQQWSNGGTVTGNTLELAIEGEILRTPNFSWRSTLVGDRSRGKVVDWPFACENPAWRYRCDNVGIYSIWGGHFLRGRDELARHHGGAAVEFANEFDVNDDGFLVWVGEGNTYRDGIDKNLWGTSTTIGGQIYQWGIPFLELNELGGGRRQQIGDGSNVNLGWINNFNYRGISLHAQFHAQLGGEIINSGFRDLVPSMRSPIMDQSGKADELKKPILYYETLRSNTGNDAWLEEGDYLKLRTVTASYRLDRPRLERIGLGRLGMEAVNVGFTARNLFTITNFSGFDPEQGLNFASLSSVAGIGYPSTRNYTAEIQVTF